MNAMSSMNMKQKEVEKKQKSVKSSAPVKSVQSKAGKAVKSVVASLSSCKVVRFSHGACLRLTSVAATTRYPTASSISMPRILQKDRFNQSAWSSVINNNIVTNVMTSEVKEGEKK